jgi:hypothetical protein
MNAHKLETVLSQDGQLLLEGLSFRAGDVVELIVLAQSALTTQPGPDRSDQLYLAGISGMMEEWESAADEAAYQDLSPSG